jgi:hypothetical protein
MKKSFLMLFVAAALMGCAKSEISPIGEDAEITLRSNIIDASVVSRAPVEGVSIASPLDARVVASVTNNFAVTYANGIMQFRENTNPTNYAGEGFVGTSTFPNDTDPVYLYGLYPAAWTVTAGGLANVTFTGKEDAMATEKISTVKQDVIDGNYKVLSFKHLLTRLEVKLSASVQVNLGDVTSIKLIGNEAGTASVDNKADINQSGAALAPVFSSSGVTSLDFYKLSLDDTNKKVYSDNLVSSAPNYTLTVDPTLVAYSMVAPVVATAAADEYFLEIITSNAPTAPYKISVDLIKTDGGPFEGSTAGHSFAFSIYFKSIKQIAVDAVIEPWDEQGEWKGEVSID